MAPAAPVVSRSAGQDKVLLRLLGTPTRPLGPGLLILGGLGFFPGPKPDRSFSGNAPRPLPPNTWSRKTLVRGRVGVRVAPLVLVPRLSRLTHPRPPRPGPPSPPTTLTSRPRGGRTWASRSGADPGQAARPPLHPSSGRPGPHRPGRRQRPAGPRPRAVKVGEQHREEGAPRERVPRARAPRPRARPPQVAWARRFPRGPGRVSRPPSGHQHPPLVPSLPLPRSQVVPRPPSPFSPRSGRGARDARSSAGAGAGGCAAGMGGADRLSAAQPQCHPTPPTWPPALPPAQPAGPRAGTTRETRKTFFSLLLQKLFLVGALVPLGRRPRASLEDGPGGWAREMGCRGLWHPQDPQDPPPPWRDPTRPSTPPPNTLLMVETKSRPGSLDRLAPSRDPAPGPAKNGPRSIWGWGSPARAFPRRWQR